MDRVNGLDFVDLGGGKRGFRDQNDVAGVAGTQITADWLNGVQEELLYLIEQVGIAPNAAVNLLLARSLRAQRMNFAAAGGTANALTFALTPAPASLAELDGAPLHIRVSLNNTGAATAAANGLAAKPIVTPNGEPIRQGDLIANAIVTLMYASALDAYLLITGARAAGQAVGFAANTYAGGNLPSSVSTNVRFSNLVYDSHNGYASLTGIYTVPVPGAYIVSGNFWFADISEATQLFAVQNGTSRAENAAWTRGRVLSVSALMKCAAGDQLRLAVAQGNASPMAVPAGSFQHAFGASLIGSI